MTRRHAMKAALTGKKKRRGPGKVRKQTHGSTVTIMLEKNEATPENKPAGNDQPDAESSQTAFEPDTFEPTQITIKRDRPASETGDAISQIARMGRQVGGARNAEGEETAADFEDIAKHALGPEFHDTLKRVVRQSMAELAVAGRNERDEGDPIAQSLLADMNDGIVGLNEDGVVQTFSPAAERIFGYAADEVIGRAGGLLLSDAHGNEGGFVSEADRAATRFTNRYRELQGRRRDGSVFDFEITLSRMRVDGRRVFVAVIHAPEAILQEVPKPDAESEVAYDDVSLPPARKAGPKAGSDARAPENDPGSEVAEKDGDADASRDQLESRLIELEQINSATMRQAGKVMEMADQLSEARKAAEENWIKTQAVLETVAEGIFTTDGQGRIESVNPAAEKLMGLSADAARGRNVAELVPEQDGDPHAGYLADHLVGEEPEAKTVERRVRRPDGLEVPVEFSLTPMMIGDVRKFTGVLRDIADRKQSEAMMRRMALNDALTGLANRNLFERKLDDALGNARRLDRMVGVMYLDLDKFKTINDTHGHDAGDVVLQTAAKRLKLAVRDVDTVARLGGDEFAVVLANLETTDVVGVIAERILESIAEPIDYKGRKLKTATSIGISFFPHDAPDNAELLKKADLALYQAKSAGRGTYHLYDDVLHTEALRKRELETQLSRALARDELELWFQPRFSLAEGTLTGAEALLRWRHPERGLVHPADFVSAAEMSGLVTPLGDWVMRTACLQAKAWQVEGLPEFAIAVNVAARQFRGEDFADSVRKAIDSSGLHPSLLELELTEGAVVEDPDHMTGAFETLRAMGVNLVIDDFGTGFTSLNLMRKLPVQGIKIDRSYISRLTDDAETEAIVSAVIRLGHSLKLQVTAEAVERQNELEALKTMGCDEATGYFFCRPLPADDFAEWVKAWNRGANRVARKGAAADAAKMAEKQTRAA